MLSLRFSRRYLAASLCRNLSDEPFKPPSKLKQLIALSTPKLNYKTPNIISNDIRKYFYNRHQRKRKQPHAHEDNFVRAYSTAEEYHLEGIVAALRREFPTCKWKFLTTEGLAAEQNVLYASCKQIAGTTDEVMDALFFRDGSVILWNFDEREAKKMLKFLKAYEKESYSNALVNGECEIMPYAYIPKTLVDIEGNLVAKQSGGLEKPRAYFAKGKCFLTAYEDDHQNGNNATVLEKYTYSNAIAASTKLAIWEATLDQYIESMETLTDNLKMGRRLRISRASALRKTGELMALRRLINLSSDLLDTPDFYWDREHLESLYLQVCSYYSVTRRVSVMNEKLNHCVELAELVLHNANESNMVRLEWVVIILIMISVGFEVLHFIH